MSKGFEGWILLAPETGGWLKDGSTARGNFLFADSESLRPNVDIKERTNKITFGRGVKASTRTIGKIVPGGDLEFQFRSDDLPFLLQSHFQKFVGTYFTGTGSFGSTSRFTFVHEKAVPSFGGSAFGTGGYTASAGNVFTIGAVKKFFDTTENGGTNAQWYKSCLVDQLVIRCDADDDAKITASLKAGTADLGTAISSASNPNSVLGSYSTKSVFNSWSVSIAWGGGTLPFNNFELTSMNGLEERVVLGALNPIDYRYGRSLVEGSGELDFPYDGLKYFGTLIGGSSFSVIGTLSNGTTDFMTFSAPNCRLKDFDTPLKPGDETVTTSLPFMAYESEDGLTAPLTVVVHTNTYGSVPWVRT